MDESWSSIHFPLHYEPFRRAGLSFQRFRRALKAARLRRPLSICSPALPHLWSWHSASVCTWEGVDAELVRSVHSPSVCSHSVTTELCMRVRARVTEQVVGTTTPVLFFFNMRRERAYFYICGWEGEERHCLHPFFYSLAPPNLHRLVPFYFFPAAGDVFALCVIDRTTLAARPVFLAKLEANSQGVIRRPCSCFLWSEKMHKYLGWRCSRGIDCLQQGLVRHPGVYWPQEFNLLLINCCSSWNSAVQTTRVVFLDCSGKGY